MDKHEAALMAYMEAFYLDPTNKDYKEYAKTERKIVMGKGNNHSLQYVSAMISFVLLFLLRDIHDTHE